MKDLTFWTITYVAASVGAVACAILTLMVINRDGAGSIQALLPMGGLVLAAIVIHASSSARDAAKSKKD